MNTTTHAPVRRTRGWPSTLSLLAFGAFLIAPTTRAQVIYEEDFQSGGGSWYATNGVWEVGVPSAGPTNLDPTELCAATNLAGDYPFNTDSRFESPSFLVTAIDKAAGEELWLEFMGWFSYGACDSAVAAVGEYQGAGVWSWTNLGTSVIDGSDWSLKGVDLTAYAPDVGDPDKLVKVGFAHYADDVSYNCSGSGAGWYVDDVVVQVREPVFTGGFEGGWAGWTAERGVWQVGVPGVGPAVAHGGIALAGTNLGGSHPGNTDSKLVSPTLTLPALLPQERLSLRYWQWFSYSSCDAGYVQVQVRDPVTLAWSGWTGLGESMVNNSAWSQTAVDLTAYAGQTVRVAFLHAADSSSYGCGGTSSGWYIDDVHLRVSVPTFEGHFELDWADAWASRGVWEVGLPSATPGPGDAHTGLAIAATTLDGAHPGDTDSRLVLAEVTLPTVTGFEEIDLRFWHWFSYSSCDYGAVQLQAYDPVADSWSGWSDVGGHVTNSSGPGWTLTQRSLTAHAGETVRLALLHVADSVSYNCGATSSGWYVDDVHIVHGFPGKWADLSLAVPGSFGKPVLTGTGTLVAGDSTTIELTAAQPGAIVGLVYGYDVGFQPLKSGLLVPLDQIIAWPLITDGTGMLTLSGAWPSGVPGGTSVYFQAWVADGGAPAGYSASNALLALTQ